jgi:membrane protein insertase Oxa1/YidC/SpoIIIJ
MDIANDEELMTMVANIETLKQTVKDTLDSRTNMVKAISDFAAADQYIFSQVPVYKKLYKRAYQLSLIQKLAPQLEKAKAREQLVFGKLQTSHDAAMAAAELVPILKPRMSVIDEQFVVMKSVSEKVQALEYKPLIQRVKDYLIGLAAVAIILLFFNMVVSKYKTYKQKLASMKKMNEMIKIQGKDTQYPTI